MKGNQGTLMRALYEAGHTQRWHTMPHHGQALVNSHSWGVAVFILCFHDGNPSTDELDAQPGPSPELIRAALLHDVHERWSGDGPSPARRDVPALQKGEDEVQHRFWSWAEPLWADEPHPELSLSARDRVWLKLADAAEAWMWTQHQLALGNVHVMAASRGCWEAVERIITTHSSTTFVDAEGLLQAIRESNPLVRLPEGLAELEENY